MIKLEYIIGAGVVLLWLKGRKKQQSETQQAETASSQRGSDWIGVGGLYDMWDRLSGSDLLLKDYPNASGSVSADFSKVTRRDMGLAPAWDGSLVQP